MDADGLANAAATIMSHPAMTTNWISSAVLVYKENLNTTFFFKLSMVRQPYPATDYYKGSA